MRKDEKKEEPTEKTSPEKKVVKPDARVDEGKEAEEVVKEDKEEKDEEEKTHLCPKRTQVGVVGARGFEPPTPSSRTKYATGLRYALIF